MPGIRLARRSGLDILLDQRHLALFGDHQAVALIRALRVETLEPAEYDVCEVLGNALRLFILVEYLLIGKSLYLIIRTYLIARLVAYLVLFVFGAFILRTAYRSFDYLIRTEYLVQSALKRLVSI